MTKLWLEGPKKEKLETGLLPYLKVWTRHWFVPLEQSQQSGVGPGVNHLIRKLFWKEWALGWFNCKARSIPGELGPFNREAYRSLTFFSISKGLSVFYRWKKVAFQSIAWYGTVYLQKRYLTLNKCLSNIFFCYRNTAYSGCFNSFTHRKGQSLKWTEIPNFIL